MGVLVVGKNDLETYCIANHKEYLLSEWDYDKNHPLTPKDVTWGSNKKRWWICPKGHSYESMVQNRAKKNFQCPICSSQKLLSGYNDLATKRPEIIKYWDFKKNDPILPTQVMAFSNKRVFWKCPDCGNEWDAVICRTKGCPKCTDNYKVSESENIIYYYLSQFFPDVELSYHATWLGRREIDVYIPSIKVAIEYDGEFWHKSITKRDLEKSSIIHGQGIFLIRMREQKLESINDSSYQITVPSDRYTFDRLNAPLHELFDVINRERSLSINPDIDVFRDWKTILSTAAKNKKERSILALYPDIAESWNYEKNEGLRPENFLPGSQKKVWWKCPNCGYEWEEIISNRTKRQLPCAKCGRDNTHRLIPGVNDLPSKHPEIAAEWDYLKNGTLKPEQFSYGASIKVWWKCSICGHEWQSTIANRSTGFGCPFCGRKKASKSYSDHMLHKGENDLLSVNPTVALQWDYDKNKELTPDSITAYSNKKVWWKCPVCGNGWQATVASRIHGKNCPFCTNRRFKKGFNDFITVAPQLRDEWNYDKNGDLDPSEIICTSTKKVWWRCAECGTEWKSPVRSRWIGVGCPTCGIQQAIETKNNNRIASGNTFSNSCPEAAKEWHPTKNGNLTPDKVSAKSGMKVWWKCKHGHEWEATIHHRANGTGCPICADIERGKAKSHRIINLDTNEVFDSIGEAAAKYNVSISALSTCLHGRTKRAGRPKCHWGFYDTCLQNIHQKNDEKNDDISPKHSVNSNE